MEPKIIEIGNFEIKRFFDKDGELEFCMEGAIYTEYCYLGREEVKQLRDHLNKLLKEYDGN